MKLPPAVIIQQGEHTVTATSKRVGLCCDWIGHEIIDATCTCGSWTYRATTRQAIDREAHNHVRRYA